MKIALLVVGKTTDNHLQNCIAEYFKRLTHYIPFEIQIIPELKNTKGLSCEVQREKEGELILKSLADANEVILLDEKGTQFTSLEFSQQIEKQLGSGKKKIVFVIGGPYGFSKDVYETANSKISLSKMTFSHQMIRLIFVEQLYRAMTILKNEPYHHE